MPLDPRFSLLFLLTWVGLGCAPVEPIAEPDLPCIPRSTMCSGARAMALCADDGLRWDRTLCESDEACLSALPGAGCERTEGGVRSLEENLAATARLVLPGGGYCSAFFVNDTDVVTNHHCCPDAGSCVGGLVQTEFRSEDGTVSEDHSVTERLHASASLDMAVLRLDFSSSRPPPHVLFAAESDYTREEVYVVGHPRGRPIETSLGLLFHYADEVTYQYRSGPKIKRSQILYWAQAEPGSSGSPVFIAGTHALVALHHTGGLSPDAFELTREQTAEFTSLLGATDASAIARELESVGVRIERQESRYAEER